MGGNAFPNKNVLRIAKEDLNEVYQTIVKELDYPNLTVDYIVSAQLGSTGKNATSGDIDIAINDFSNPYDQLSFDWDSLVKRVQQVLPQEQLYTKHYNKMRQINILWPYKDDFVQVDFLYGNLEYMQFAHFSPGEENSSFKGVYLTTALGVIAKMATLWSFENSRYNVYISYNLDLNDGLAVRYRVYDKTNNSKKNFTAEAFETKFPAISSPRWGFLNDVSAIVRVLFDDKTVWNDVNSFEKTVNWLKKNRPFEFEKFKTNFIYSFRNKRHMPMSMEELENHDVWN
jgi:hypothetical protein